MRHQTFLPDALIIIFLVSVIKQIFAAQSLMLLQTPSKIVHPLLYYQKRLTDQSPETNVPTFKYLNKLDPLVFL